MVELGDLFIVSDVQLGATGAQQRQEFFDILDLSKHLGFHLRLSLQLVLRGVGQLLNVVEWENPGLASQ